MTEDNCHRVSSSESTDFSTTKQRKKRKWDQPDESLVSAGVALPGILPLANPGSLARISLPVVIPVSGASIINPLSTTGASLPQVLQVPLQQHAAAIVQKFVQPKIQDELIAREIVINDADSAVRYKLTKRQTQEEIQKCTGAIVITRGKYRPPNAPPDGERPLYLHISAGAHLETTAERIKVVDHAASMVEEILNQGSVNNGVKVNPLFTACVFLGFEADPSLNVASRIRGPNDQYVNHIMSETGATVLLRGRGSGNSENALGEEAQQPLHLLLSSNDPINLERAKLLAGNLLDTISAECGASRASSCKVYVAVPPPPQLLGEVQNSGNEPIVKEQAASGLTSSGGVIDDVSHGAGLQSMGLSDPGMPQPSPVCHPHSSLIGGTSYNGYEGIYPQATPLQQVALALRQPTSPVTATVGPATTATSAKSPIMVGPSKEKRPSQRRKFQELSTAAKAPATSHQNKLQGSEFQMPRELTSHVGARDVPITDVIPPPPPKSMPPPPPPPKFNSTPKVHENNSMLHKSKPEPIPDTLIKLMEYGDDDDELEETIDEPSTTLSSAPAAPKPFWAV
ncbi:Protein RIK [Forsythia ovata]|uniref:Protein RIK n=1 Tax=Forsythia ovata TaxID=205694 RepID=A0ABD1UU88_9LAMI